MTNTRLESEAQAPLDSTGGVWVRRAIGRLTDWRWALLLVGLTLAAVSYGPSQRITMNRSIENMFAADDPVLRPYRLLKETFGGNEMVLAVYEDPALLAPDGTGIRRLARVAERLRGVPGVRDVLSLDRPIGELIAAPDNPLAIRLREAFAGYTHGIDGRTAAAVCMLEDERTARAAGNTREISIAGIRAVIEDLPDGLPDGLIAGEPVLVVEGFESLEADGQLLATWSTALVALTIVVCFRSLRWVAIPLAVVQVTVWTTRAILYWADVHLSLVSSMLSAIITVVGIATMVHLLVAYRAARTDGLDPRRALVHASTLLAAPIIWSLITDAAGFGSLLASHVGPVRDFGLMTAVGSLLVLAVILLLTPGMALAGSWDVSPRQAWGEHNLGRVLRWVTAIVDRRPRLVGALAILVTVLAALGIRRIDVETDFTKNFRDGSPIVQSYETIESRFGGAGVLDAILPAPESLSWQYLELVQRLQNRLRDEVRVATADGRTTPGLTKVLSASDAIRAAALTDPGSLPFETARDLLVRGGWEAMRVRMPAFAAALYAPDPQDSSRAWFRVMMRARERQPAAEKLKLIEQVQRIVDEELASPEWTRVLPSPAAPGAAGASSPSAPRGYVTGYFVLLTNLIASTVRDQWTSFGIATAGVFAALLVSLRRPALAIIALIPNAIPIVFVLGVLGWLDLKMNLGAAMIAAVSMGLSVDSSIHYILSVQRKRRQGMSMIGATIATQQEVGRAVVFSTLALVVGFSVLCTSQFMPTVYFGLLVSLAMLGGLVGNLVILPLLIPRLESIVATRTTAR